MTAKRILFFHENFPAGGAERVTIDIANYISDYGYEVYVAACNIREEDCPNITTLKIPNGMSVVESPGIQHLVNVIHSLNIAVFVLPVSPFVPLLEAIQKQTTCKLVFALHSVPFWEVLYHLYIKKKKARGNLLKTLEWWCLTYPKTMWLRKYDPPVRKQHSRVLNLVDAYTTLCEDYKNDLLSQTKLLSLESKIHVIPNSEKAVSPVNFDKKKQILFVGRMTYDDKRVDRLIYIWRKIYKKAPDWELILVGDGDEKKSLEALVIKLRLERVTFAGYHSDVHQHYKNASILCLTSNYEGWPLVLTEAQANGVIPVAFDCTAGVHEILSPTNVNGLLIPPFSKRQYAKRLLELMQDTERCRNIQQNAVLKVQNYSPVKIGEQWRVLFDSLCNSDKKNNE